jgi:hypothetical protein
MISLGNTDEFVPVPPGESILIHTKRVHKLRYIHPHTHNGHLILITRD